VPVATGEFQAHMAVALVNDGPVTLILDNRRVGRLNMARAGFTAIHSGRIKFGKDGRWYCDGETIPNKAICRLYAKAMTIDDDGTARLRLGEDKAQVDIEDHAVGR
jgi:hypothetical protein